MSVNFAIAKILVLLVLLLPLEALVDHEGSLAGETFDVQDIRDLNHDNKMSLVAVENS